MNRIADLLVDAFNQAHPLAQVLFLLLILGLAAVMAILYLRERSRLLRMHDLLERLTVEHQESRKQLTAIQNEASASQRLNTQMSAEFQATLEKYKDELTSIRQQANRDRKIIENAVPAWERVTRRNDELLAQLEDLRAANQQLTAEVATLRQSLDQNSKTQEELEAIRARELRVQGEVAELRQRFDSLQKIDTDVWLAASSLHGSIPKFVHREQRKTRFVTFLNLKGGVGKTTLTANLAAAFATGVLGDPKRVLAVDLDYQGTLSNLCVEQQLLRDRRATRWTSDRLLDSDSADDAAACFLQLMVPMNGAERAQVIVTDEQLDHADFRGQAIYSIDRGEIRFHHRRLFHQPAIFDQFDFVFFDCPPRLTASTINALIASDWIVVPTSLDPNDVEAVPRTLRWLEKLQTQPHVDFHAKLGGIILNATFRQGTEDVMASYEKEGLHMLKTAIQKFSPTGDAILKNTIKDDRKVPKSAANKIPHGATDSGRNLFGDVARELYERIKN